MPHIIALTGSGSAQRKLLADCLTELRGGGYDTSGRFAGESWQDLFDMSRTAGLFDELRAVVVESADSLGPLPEEFHPEVAGAGSGDVFVLVFDQDPLKILPTQIMERISLRKPRSIPYWVDSRIQWLERESSKRKIRITRGALHLLAECVEDPEEMSVELDKLGAASGGSLVGEDMVRALTVDEGGRQMLALLDGLCRGETGIVLEAISSLRRREEPLKIISALHKRMRVAMYLAMAGGNPGKEAETALEIKPYQGKIALEAAGKYPVPSIRRFVTGMVRESVLAKSGLSSGWDGIELEILRFLDSSRK